MINIKIINAIFFLLFFSTLATITLQLHNKPTIPKEAHQKTELIQATNNAPLFSIAIHGGAGVIPHDPTKQHFKQQRILYTKALKACINLGENILATKGKTPLDAVEACVAFLEDCPLFNAGRGAVLNKKGKHELEACIMESEGLSIGAVALLRKTKNPISAARFILDEGDSSHFLVGAQAEKALFKRMKKKNKHVISQVPNNYFTTPLRSQQWKDYRTKHGLPILDHDHQTTFSKKDLSLLAKEVNQLIDSGNLSTVGCVAWKQGLGCAAATSTGGLINKPLGRVGDSPLIGSSTYAHPESAAISCTGRGEEIMRHTIAAQIHGRMTYGKETLSDACHHALFESGIPEGTCGVIAIDTKTGNIVMDFNTAGMFRAARHRNGHREVGIWDLLEKI